MGYQLAIDTSRGEMGHLRGYFRKDGSFQSATFICHASQPVGLPHGFSRRVPTDFGLDGEGQIENGH